MNIITTRDVIFAIVGGAIVAGSAWWNANKPSLQSTLATTSKDLQKVAKRKIECQPVIIYTDVAKKAVGLPETVKADPEQHVLAATQVKQNERPVTVSAVLDSGTGQTSMYQRLDRLPWLAFDKRVSLGIAYGYKNDTDGLVTRIYGRYDLIQIKSLHAGILADVDNARGWYGGGFVEARW